MQDIVDLLIVIVWCYSNGFLFAWLMGPPLPPAPKIAAWFGLIGMLLGVYGIERRRKYGKFPVGITYIVFGFTFLCSFIGVTYRVVVWLQEWLGVI